MNFYEHTIIARQDVGASQLKQIQETINEIKSDTPSADNAANILYKKNNRYL